MVRTDVKDAKVSTEHTDVPEANYHLCQLRATRTFSALLLFGKEQYNLRLASGSNKICKSNVYFISVSIECLLYLYNSADFNR